MSSSFDDQELPWPFPEPDADVIEGRLRVVAHYLTSLMAQQDVPQILIQIIDEVLHQPRKLLVAPIRDGKHLQRQDGGLWPLHALLIHAAVTHADTPEAPPAAWELGVPVAAAVELLGAALDVFDDVQDGDGDLITMHGVPMMINAAMALRETAQSALADARIPRALQSVLQETCASDTLRAIGGQTLDIAFEQQAHVTIDEAIDMTERKSGSLVGLVYRLGALVGLYGRYRTKRLLAVSQDFATFGRTMGVSIQLENDWRDARREAHKSDRQRGKKTLPLVVEAEKMPPGLTGEEQDMFVLRMVQTMISLYRRRARTQLAALSARYHLSSRWLHWAVSD